MKDLFSYTDYRKYLADFYGEHKKKTPSFSYSVLAQKAGFRTKTFLHKVIHGEKELPRQSVYAVAQAMGLKKRETEYFTELVNFNQARTTQEREFHFNQLQSFGKTSAGTILRQNQFDYFSEWYHAVLRELVTITDFGEDYTRLSRMLEPPITPTQARRGVQLLLDLGIIVKAEKGLYKQTNKSITTGEHVANLAVHRFQKENMQLASESLDRFDKNDRDISSLTCSISQKGLEALKGELESCRKKMIAIIEKDEPVDRVYQLNFQLFPVSRLK
jgi:uncharacterized protein (TIGR02147 family)